MEVPFFSRFSQLPRHSMMMVSHPEGPSPKSKAIELDARSGLTVSRRLTGFIAIFDDLYACG